MPIYTYRCEHCGVQFDRRQSFDDAPLTICPECETETLRKVYLPVGIVFKGSGFYATDNRSPSGMDARLPGDGSETKSETSSKETAVAPKKEKTKSTKKKD